MRSRWTGVLVGVLFVAAGGLTACYESPNSVKLHKPGVYKGGKDPLLEKQRSPEQQARLRERFDLVQRDRSGPATGL